MDSIFFAAGIRKSFPEKNRSLKKFSRKKSLTWKACSQKQLYRRTIVHPGPMVAMVSMVFQIMEIIVMAIMEIMDFIEIMVSMVAIMAMENDSDRLGRVAPHSSVCVYRKKCDCNAFLEMRLQCFFLDEKGRLQCS